MRVDVAVFPSGPLPLLQALMLAPQEPPRSIPPQL